MSVNVCVVVYVCKCLGGWCRCVCGGGVDVCVCV